MGNRPAAGAHRVRRGRAAAPLPPLVAGHRLCGGRRGVQPLSPATPHRQPAAPAGRAAPGHAGRDCALSDVDPAPAADAAVATGYRRRGVGHPGGGGRRGHARGRALRPAEVGLEPPQERGGIARVVPRRQCRGCVPGLVVPAGRRPSPLLVVLDRGAGPGGAGRGRRRDRAHPAGRQPVGAADRRRRAVGGVARQPGARRRGAGGPATRLDRGAARHSGGGLGRLRRRGGVASPERSREASSARSSSCVPARRGGCCCSRRSCARR